MILVNLRKTWPAVLAGHADPAQVTLGAWAALTEDDLAVHGDVLLGVHKNVVVTAYSIAGWTRDEATGRVTFDGEPSDEWAELIGQRVPGSPWVKGAARPVKVLDTAVARGVAVSPRADPTGRLTADLGPVSVLVEPDGRTTVRIEPGIPVTVISG